VALQNRKSSEIESDFLARDANNLNILRLLAALAVVVSHYALLRSGHESAEPFADITYFNLGDYALIVFFFISGLTVSASYARRRSIADFVVARVLRIWPALFAVVFVTVFVVAPFFSSVSFRAFFNDPAWRLMIAKTFVLSGPIGGLPGLFETNPVPVVVNGSPWTLRFEALFYAILIAGSLASARFSSRASAIWIPATTLITGFVLILVPVGAAATTLDYLLRFWFAFGLGATAYQFRKSLPNSIPVAAFWMSLTGAVFISAIGSACECFAAILATCAATLFFAQVPIKRLRALTNRFDLSYGVYITAWPITQILVARAPWIPFGVMLAMIIAMSLALAFASWILIEKPALGFRPRLISAYERLFTGWRRNEPAIATRNLRL
jgi:peptidoglycan/LPS O-acetylase OafA/YrhL